MVEKFPYLSLAILLSMAVLTPACKTTPANKVTSGFKKDKSAEGSDSSEKPKDRTMKLPIGTVHMVDKNAKFVLIKSTRGTNLDPEAKMTSYGPNAQVTAHLKISPARKGSYLTADFTEGMPSIGDTVIVEHTIKAAESLKPEGEDATSDIQILE